MSILRKIPTILGAGGGSLLPPELQGCEYLQSDGDSFIKLDERGLNLDYLEFDCIYESGGASTLFGCYSENNVRLQLYYDTVWKLRYYNFSTVLESNVTNKNLSFKIADGKADFNGDILTLTELKSIDLKIYLFCINHSGVHGNITLSKIKKFKTQNCNIVSSYIKNGNEYIDNKGVLCPAGTSGFFDIQNNIFYTNDGTGQFSHGADINI